MTIFSNLYERLVSWRRPKPPPGMEERLSWLLQPYLHTIEDILMWKNTSISLAFFIFANILLWLLRTYNVRILGILGGVLLSAVILDAVATYLGQRKAASSAGGSRRGIRSSTGSANRPAPQLREVGRRVTAALLYATDQLIVMRNTNHAQFCALVCGSITTLWLVIWLGGGLLWHSLLNASLLSFLIPSLEATIKQHSDSDGEIEGFLPELSPLALKELNAAGEHVPEPPEFSSLMSDLSLPSDDAVLRYATGEASSSEDEGDGKGPPTPDPPNTDSTDSDSEFLINEKNKKSNTDKISRGAVDWFGAVPSAPTPLLDSDSDEFEIVDKDNL